MSIFKKSISFIVVSSMLFTISASAFAQEAQPELVQYHLESDVVDENFVVVGTKYLDTTVEVTEKAEGKETILIETETYTFYENSEKFSELFPDNTKKTEILITDENEYFINDQKLSEEELFTPLTVDVHKDNLKMSLMATGAESGGLTWLSYYTNQGQKPYDVFNVYSYQTTDFFMDYGQGSHLSSSMNTSPRLSDFKMYANNAASARSGINQGMGGLAASGVAAIPNAIIGAIGISASAYIVYSNSVAGRAAVENAYRVIAQS